MKRFIYQTRVAAPIERVAAFHRDSRALKLLTPPPVFVQLHKVQPLEEGSVSDFTLWFGPLPVRWVAVHSDVDPLHGFTDSQVRGPFAIWTHRHSFSRIDLENTWITDEIQASTSSHPFWWLFGQLMWASLPLLFAYRGLAVRQALKSQARNYPDPLSLSAGENKKIP